MKAVVFDGELKFDENYMEPERKENEALIKPLLLGVCNTDEEITKGYMGYNGVLGHEFVGVVVDSDDKSLINKRVVGEINLGCNNCPECSNNLQRHCKQRSTFGIYKKDGCFSELFTLPNSNLLVVPDNVDDAVNFIFCTNVDTSSRFIEKEYFRISFEPFSDNNFLLITTRKSCY